LPDSRRWLRRFRWLIDYGFAADADASAIIFAIFHYFERCFRCFSMLMFTPRRYAHYFSLITSAFRRHYYAARFSPRLFSAATLSAIAAAADAFAISMIFAFSFRRHFRRLR